MKKSLFLAAAAVAVLASCSQDEMGKSLNIENENNAIGFSAYNSTATTRGSIKTVDSFKADGIGVFAFYQPAATGYFNTYKYAVPDFMYNQKVALDVTTPAETYTASEIVEIAGENYVKASVVQVSPGVYAKYGDSDPSHNIKANVGDIKVAAVYADTWSYSPIKYWPNNTGDMVSFFAYAPYSATKTWEDLGYKTDVNNKALNITFPIYQEAADQVDYIQAAPALNKEKQKADTDGYKYAGAENIKFDFEHITSQVNLYVGVEQNTATGDPTVWDDANTTIEVKSIEFTDLSSAMTYSYDITTNSAAAVTPIMSETKQSVKLTADNFIATAATINNANFAAAEYKKLNKDNSVLFLAPEAMANAIVTYVVTSTDSGSAQNTSVVKNEITQAVGLTLEKGKAYNINFLIGVNSVKIVSKLTDWTFSGTTYVEVPANE